MSPEKREAIRLRLEAIAALNGGRITPQQVVDDARDEESPLHDSFTWDDAEAADKQRLTEARLLLRTMYVQRVDHTTVHKVLAYLRDPVQPSNKQGYISTQVLRTDADLARIALIEEFGRAAAALRRALEVAKALSLEGEVQGQIDSLSRLKARVENQHLD